MMSEVESEKISCEDSSSGRLLRDIEEISKALYLPSTLRRNKALVSKSDHRTRSIRYLDEDLLRKNENRSSIWNWKPLKILTHIRNHRLSCYFFLHVHSIEGLPMIFNNFSLSVHWKRKDGLLKTRSVRVSEGTAEFGETLMHRCTIYASRTGPHDGIARYSPKLFLLYASLVEAPGLDIGKHWVDLTRLLPLTLEELEEDKKSSGKWMTSFKLGGKAKGAVINVSFGFSICKDIYSGSSNFGKVPNLLAKSRSSRNDMLRRLHSIPINASHRTHITSPSLDIKVQNQSVSLYKGPGISQSITFLYQKLDEVKVNESNELNSFSSDVDPCVFEPESSTDNAVEILAYENDVSNFTVTDQGTEFPRKDKLKIGEDAVRSCDDSAIEIIDVAEMSNGIETALYDVTQCVDNEDFGHVKLESAVNDGSCGDDVLGLKEGAVEELESFFDNLSISESPELDFSFDDSNFIEQKNYMMAKSSCEEGKMKDSLKFYDVTDSIADDLMNVLKTELNALRLGTDTEPESPESPRERLLKQFEKEILASGSFFSDVDVMAVQEDCSDDFDSPCLIEGVEMVHDDVPSTLISRRKAHLLENLETETLMREWGLNEQAFLNSPRTDSGAFGSPVYVCPEEPPKLPPLGEGLGSTLRTKGNGYLRSMNPSLFRNAKNGESLIMQVSNPVVLPAAMGSNSMDILQLWALVGAEKMFLLANKLMSLEEITAKTLKQVAGELESKAELLERGCTFPYSEIENDLCNRRNEVKEIPTSVCNDADAEYFSLVDLPAVAMDKIQALLIEGLCIQAGMPSEEAPSSICVQSSRIGEPSSFGRSPNDVDELICMSISLDEWMALDCGLVDDKCDGDQFCKILAAHCGNRNLSRYEKCGISSGQSGGSLGDDFTMALQVLLRDPCRDYESVGTSMLALIQVERISVEMGIHVDERESSAKNVEGNSCFKITEVHVAGLKPEPGKKQQSGFRWLHSSGLGKTEKRPYFKSNAIVRSSSHVLRKQDEILWSISSYVHGAVAKWKELSALTLYTRNPDVVFK